MSITMVVGCESPETAHCTPDYPYGRTLRCQRREWLEYTTNHGYRFVTQTSNPTYPGLVWNKPHAGTYSPLAVMYLDDSTGHVEWAGLHTYPGLEKVEAFASTYADGLTGAREAAMLAALLKIARMQDARSKIEAYLRESAAQQVEGSGAIIQHAHLQNAHPEHRNGQPVVGYLCNAYTFWTRDPAQAFVFRNVAVAEGLIDAFPSVLQGATARVPEAPATPTA